MRIREDPTRGLHTNGMEQLRMSQHSLIWACHPTYNLPEVTLDHCIIIGRLWLVQRGNYSADNLPEVTLDHCIIIGRLWLVQRGNYSAVGN